MVIEAGFLQSLPYFSGLSADELEAVRRLVFERKVERGEVIIFEGESAEALFVVASGAVKVFKTSAEGKEQILSIIRPGESFNDVAVFDDGPNPASAQAMGAVVICGIAREDMKTIIGRYPPVALNIIKVMAGQVRQLLALVEDLSFRRVISRVAKILLEHAADGSGPGRRLTQQEMAAMAGTVREVVARSLRTLEEEGAIRLDRNRIVITDKPALMEMVEPSV